VVASAGYARVKGWFWWERNNFFEGDDDRCDGIIWPMTPENKERRELLVTMSVAALIEDRASKRLLLVQKREVGLWGLPAGGG